MLAVALKHSCRKPGPVCESSNDRIDRKTHLSILQVRPANAAQAEFRHVRMLGTKYALKCICLH